MRTFLTGLSMIALLAASPVQAQFRENGVLSAAPQAQETSQPKSGGGGLLGGVLSCSADGSKQELGAILGGAAGAFLGNKIAGKGNRTLGTVLGGALGAAAGSALGCKMQKKDRDKAELAAQRALDSGQSQSWNNEETGASGRFDVADNGAGGATLSTLRFAPKVEPVDNFAQVGRSYVATAASNIRSGPSSKAAILGRVNSGQSLWIPAQVAGQPWMLVATNGVAQGYVHSSLLKASSSATTASNCKMVTQTVNLPGEAAQAESYQACKGSDGQWTMTKV